MSFQTQLIDNSFVISIPNQSSLSFQPAINEFDSMSLTAIGGGAGFNWHLTNGSNNTIQIGSMQGAPSQSRTRYGGQYSTNAIFLEVDNNNIIFITAQVSIMTEREET